MTAQLCTPMLDGWSYGRLSQHKDLTKYESGRGVTVVRDWEMMKRAGVGFEHFMTRDQRWIMEVIQRQEEETFGRMGQQHA